MTSINQSIKSKYLPWEEVNTTLGNFPNPSVTLTPKVAVSLFTVANAIPEYLSSNTS